MITQKNAKQILLNCAIDVGADFHQLPSELVERLLFWAEIQHYRKPKNANGSRARYFHAYLQRRAARKD